MSNAKYTAAGYARYIGRVGALAVALGIGVGLAATPWAASAKPADQAPRRRIMAANPVHRVRTSRPIQFVLGRIHRRRTRAHRDRTWPSR